jgi:hypothetical protein
MADSARLLSGDRWSDSCLFNRIERVVNFDAEVPDGTTFEIRTTEQQQLYGTERRLFVRRQISDAWDRRIVWVHTRSRPMDRTQHVRVARTSPSRGAASHTRKENYHGNNYRQPRAQARVVEQG